MPTIAVGVDIGQKRDPTAIAVVEPEFRDVNGRREDYYLVRFLERQPLGTPYPQVASRVHTVVSNVRQHVLGAQPQPLFGQPRAPSIQLFVDATGVGQPVVDLLKGGGVRVQAVYFTHGDRRTKQQDGSVSLGKAWLVSRLQALLQTGRILLPRTQEAEALGAELLDYEIKVDQDANEKYGAFKVGSHDDLVTALGLCVQEPAREYRITVIEHDDVLPAPALSKTYWRTGR
jgi:hypothetical protein